MENIFCSDKEHRKKFWIKRIIFVPIFMILALLFLGCLVMFLWNFLFPEIFGVGTITFWQALGILILSKILFGGIPGKNYNRKIHRSSFDIKERLRHLSPEGREKLRKEMFDKFGDS
jgi:Ca2+/H+ antiporter, TMEM165/GDT1 family